MWAIRSVPLEIFEERVFNVCKSTKVIKSKELRLMTATREEEVSVQYR